MVITSLAAGTLMAAMHSQPAEHADTPRFDDLAFLAGHWLYEFEGGLMEEVWLPPRDGNMTGTMRQVVDATPNMFELFTLTRDQDAHITFRLRHFDAALHPWDMDKDGPMIGTVTESAAGRCVISFDGARLASIVYELHADTLTSSVNFPPSSGREPIVLKFQRQ